MENLKNNGFNPIVKEIIFDELIREGYSQVEVLQAYAIFTSNRNNFNDTYVYGTQKEVLKTHLSKVLEGGIL
ncbi:hypothetical protein [Virgibacillus sp. SK37]|uniref:hypothetical protein n=1 Tax=Virgibacillus sp. SK37 TaxID=403957 RepID=UPI0004D0DA7F|nr:hypothetical protein [Virgibacillus sp. SK37]AIF45667.1 hypothetical protein X953_18940 [Virgibacillus sp. SK37]